MWLKNPTTGMAASAGSDLRTVSASVEGRRALSRSMSTTVGACRQASSRSGTWRIPRTSTSSALAASLTRLRSMRSSTNATIISLVPSFPRPRRRCRRLRVSSRGKYRPRRSSFAAANKLRIGEEG
jgi:hypothetical protein